MRKFHRFIRGQLWCWATLLALFIVFSWIFGGAAWSIVQWVVLPVVALLFAELVWSGWVEWRERRNATGND
jgi:hypothetical protein